MSEASTEFRLRHFRMPDDISPLLQLLVEAENVDHSGEDISEATVMAQLTTPAHDPLLDRCVVEHPTHANTIIGQSALWTMPTSADELVSEMVLLVHPQWRKRGIGSALLEQALQRAKHMNADFLNSYVDAQHSESIAFARKHQFHAIAAYTEMGMSQKQLSASLPADFRIQAYATFQHLPTLVDAFNRSYQGIWGHHQLQADDLQGWLPELDQQGLFVLFAPDGAVAGVCRVEQHTQRSTTNGLPTGYIDAPGIVPEYRSKALYQALLIHALGWLGQRVERVELESWGDSPDILALYQTLGFSILRQQQAYQCSLMDFGLQKW